MPFHPTKDIPDLTGKTILITGANSGLGKTSVLEFSRHNPSQIWLAARNLTKAQSAADEIKQQVPTARIHLLELDLSSFASIQKAVEVFLSTATRLDILMLNAGVMAAPPGMTPDGRYEVQFGTNYMGHALLTRLLLPIMERTAKRDDAGVGGRVRIVAVASHGQRYAPPGGLQFETFKTNGESMGPFARYGQSKLALVLWVRMLAQLYPWLTAASIDPGVVGTTLGDGATGAPRYIQFLFEVALVLRLAASLENGVRNQLWAAVSREVNSGEYYDPVGVVGKSAFGRDEELARRLWVWTEGELDNYLGVRD
ncbi:hypothetical protein AnigIFM60653_000759 [Aspergillus niger]|nr:hypothetical protein AnigIFM60653_000759 [Aspergillus niger]